MKEEDTKIVGSHEVISRWQYCWYIRVVPMDNGPWYKEVWGIQRVDEI
jgi:hypothetical protein